MSNLLIYALVDPRTNLTRYIGKSTIGLRRPAQHAKRVGRDTSHRSNWIRELLRLGLRYEVIILEELAVLIDLDEAERRWIAHGRTAGWPLTNLTDGGEGASSPRPDDTKAKISAACRRPEVIAKTRAANKGRSFTGDHRENLSQAHKGIRPTVETRAKMSAAHMGHSMSPKARAALRLGPRAPHQRTDASRAQIETLHEMARGRPRPDLSERNRAGVGRKASDETRAKMSAAKKGKPFSPEHRAKISAALRARAERLRAEREGE